MLEDLKEHVPLVLMPHAKDLLEQYIRDDMNEPKAAGVPTFLIVYMLIKLFFDSLPMLYCFLIALDLADYYSQQIQPKIFTLAEINSTGHGGISAANNGLERRNGVHKSDQGYKKQGLTQYIPAAFAWLEEESARDLEFSSKMAKGYSRATSTTGVYVDKRVWGQPFWERVLKEFDRPDDLGVHNLFFKFQGGAFLVCSEHMRNSFASETG